MTIISIEDTLAMDIEDFDSLKFLLRQVSEFHGDQLSETECILKARILGSRCLIRKKESLRNCKYHRYHIPELTANQASILKGMLDLLLNPASMHRRIINMVKAFQLSVYARDILLDVSASDRLDIMYATGFCKFCGEDLFLHSNEKCPCLDPDRD